MFKLVLEKAEKPDIKLPTSAGSWKKQESSRNIFSCFIDYVKAFDCVENSERDGNTRPPDLPFEKPVCSQEATVRTGHGKTDWFQIGKGVRQSVYCHPAYLTCWAG